MACAQNFCLQFLIYALVFTCQPFEIRLKERLLWLASCRSRTDAVTYLLAVV